MKIRNEFVTNSSSTSYTIYFNQKVATKERIKDLINTIKGYYEDLDLVVEGYTEESLFCAIINELEEYLNKLLLTKVDSKFRLDNWILDEGNCWDWDENIYNFLDNLNKYNKLPKDWLRCKFVYD